MSVNLTRTFFLNQARFLYETCIPTQKSIVTLTVSCQIGKTNTTFN